MVLVDGVGGRRWWMVLVDGVSGWCWWMVLVDPHTFFLVTENVHF
jgi:hypothetical protein